MIQINGKNYEVIKVYTNKINSLKDLILCENEYGYKECFHRIDLQNKSARSKPREWKKEETDKMRDLLSKGYTPTEISKGQYFSNRTEGAIYNRATEIRRGKY